MNLQKLFVFSHSFFSSLQDNRILSRSWFILSVDLSTWDVFEGPEAKSFVPHWPGLLYLWLGYHHYPAQLSIHMDTFIGAMRISPLNKARGIRLFSMLKVFIWKKKKNNPLCLTNEKEGVTTHFSGWVRIPRAVILFLSGKCFGFLMLFCRLVPSQPLLQDHTYTHAHPHACTVLHFPPFPVEG